MNDALRQAAGALAAEGQAIIEHLLRGMPASTHHRIRSGQSDDPRVSFIARATALLAALSTQPETDWEYGYASGHTVAAGGPHIQTGGVLPFTFAEAQMRGKPVYRRIKSIPAGPWEPVPALPEGDGVTT